MVWTTRTVELLLGKNISTEALEKTKIHLAFTGGHTGIAELLLAKMEAMGQYSNTPLHLATQNGHTSMS